MSRLFPVTFEFVADADLALDFVLQKEGVAVDLTGNGLSLAFGAAAGYGGFELTLGQGMLTPSADGRARARLTNTAVAGHRGAYAPCELRTLPSTGGADAWWGFKARIVAAASQVVASAAPLAAGFFAGNAWTITINRTASETLVSVTPGVLSGGLIGAVLTPPSVVEYTGPGVLVGELVGNSGIAPYSFTMLDDDGGRFALVGSTLLTGATPIHRADGAARTLRVRASDQGGAAISLPITLPVLPATIPSFNLPSQAGLLPMVT